MLGKLAEAVPAVGAGAQHTSGVEHGTLDTG